MHIYYVYGVSFFDFKNGLVAQNGIVDALRIVIDFS